MKAHQRIIREQRQAEGIISDLFPTVPDAPCLKTSSISAISYLTARPIIEDNEWIGTMPLPKSCRFIFGIYFNGILGGVAVFVEPSTRQFNKKHPRRVVQLNRGACLWWTPKNTASNLITRSIDLMKKHGVIAVIAYCTPEAGEYGTIYQACNFLHTGLTAKSKSYFMDNHWVSERTLADKLSWAKGKDPLWLQKFKNLKSRPQLPKLRYLKLFGSHKENKQFMADYSVEIFPYPKRAGEGSRESRTDSISEGLGQFQNPAPLNLNSGD